MFRRFATVASTFALALTVANVQGAGISFGNVLVYRVGTGAAALGNGATAVFLDEYTPLGGAPVQSIALPTTGGEALTAVGNDTSEGIMSISQNGASAVVVFTGYRANAGAANPAGSGADTVNRVIGTISLGGTVNTSVAISDPALTGTIRSATSTDGSSSFYLGASSGLSYVAAPSGASTIVGIDSRNSRQAVLAGTTLFGSATLVGNSVKVQSFGSLPVGATTGAAVVTTTTTDTVNGTALFDLNPAVPGADTLYALSTVATGKLYKYTFDGTTWTASGSIVTATGVTDLAGYTDVNGVHLFLTSGSKLYTELDSSGYGVNVTGALTQIASAGANEAFRGVAFIPEPSTVSLGLMALVGVLALRRRRA